MSEDQNETSSATLARAEMLLSILSQQAAAARAEAQYAELRLLMSEAQSGSYLRLERWLAQHAASESQLVEIQTQSIPLAATQCEVHSTPRRVHTIESWDQILPFARERLRQNKLRLHSELMNHATKVSPPAQRGDLKGNPESRSVAVAEFTQLKPAPAQAPIRRVDAKHSTPRSASKHGSAVAKKSTRQPIGQQFLPIAQPLSQPRKQTHWKRLSGIATSFLAHLALLVLLAMCTLRLPAPPASLALESATSETSAPPLEISEPIAVDSPAEDSGSSVPVTTFDVTENFVDVAASVQTALSDFSAVSQSASTAARLAAATSSSNTLVEAINANASFFGSAASGNSFCYVIDGSGSMRGGPWEAAKQEMFKSLSGLKEKQRFYIVFFNRELSAIPMPGEREPAPRTLYATPENLAHARKWMDTLRIDIGGPPNAALELAISKEPDAVYLLTDGVTQADVLGFLRKKNRLQDLIYGEQIRVPIHTIAFYSLDGQELLKQIAAENKGQFIYVPDPKKR